jgi:hypothetical protein
MAQISITGGGESYTPDGKRIIKKAYLLTAGDTNVSLPAEQGVLTSVDFSTAEAGTTRVMAQWTSGADGGASASGGQTLEVIGGSREVPIQSHPTFKDVTDAERTSIEQAIQNNTAPSIPATGRARDLYNLLLKKKEFYLVPAVSFRVTTFETTMPSLKELCTVNAPQRGPAVGSKQNWLLVSINARGVAQPTGGIVYEVSREWMLSDGNGWDPEQLVYNGT